MNTRAGLKAEATVGTELALWIDMRRGTTPSIGYPHSVRPI